MAAELPEYVLVNRAAWTRSNAEYTDRQARGAWAQEEITWGQWGAREDDVRVLPDVAGRDVIELGCGTAYVAAWLKRRGARRVVGVDVTPAQLETARRMDDEYGLGLELIEANAENVPLPDESFDLVVSEYGASIWCDPVLWIGEAARLLRVGGELVFLRGSTLQMLCMPEEGQVQERLARPQRNLYRLDWRDDHPGTEFHPPTGELFRILRQSGFELVDFQELYAGERAVDHEYYSHVPAAWAKKWPSEELWRARRRG